MIIHFFSMEHPRLKHVLATIANEQKDDELKVISNISNDIGHKGKMSPTKSMKKTLHINTNLPRRLTPTHSAEKKEGETK